MRRGTFAIVGAGRLGRTLGRLLAECGFEPSGVSCRRLRSARQAAAYIGGGRPTTENPEAAAAAALVIIATPDGQIAPVARELARGGAWSRKIVAHTSGALSSAVLDPLARAGAGVASLHPLISVAEPRAGLEDLRGVPFAIEGDRRAVGTLSRLVVALGGRPFIIPRQAKTLYHLIACLLSNDLVAFLSSGLDAAAGLGLDRREAARLYLPLVRGTLQNVVRLGPAKALTGPVSRGDAGTLRLHGEALRTLPTDLRKLHRILALRSTSLALEAGSITLETALKLTRLLSSNT
jgi:predicted short-subunit dehydrogenase-like oxidoreductase (DUF2520 family)